METFSARSSFIVTAPPEIITTKEGNGRMPEKRKPEVQGKNVSQSQEAEPLEGASELEEKPNVLENKRKENIFEEIRKPDRGPQLLLWRFIAEVLRREMTLRIKERLRQATESRSDFESQNRPFQEIFSKLEKVFYRVVKLITLPIVRLALGEYRESLAKLLSRYDKIDSLHE